MFKLNTTNPPERADEFYNFITPICSFLELNPNLPLNIVNYSLYNSYRSLITEHKITPGMIINFLKNNNYLIENIKNKKRYSYIYNQPIIALIYYLIRIHPETTKCLWNLTQDELNPLYTDMGISFIID